MPWLARRLASRFLVAFLANVLLGSFGLPGACAGDAKPTQAAHPAVPGFVRFYTQESRVEAGRLLLSELHCTSCHRAETRGDSPTPRQAPVLEGLGGRVKPAYLRKFLRHPQAHKPGSTMPEMFVGLAETEKARRIEELVHFLASPGTPSDERPARERIAAGRQLYHEVGCVACHGSRDAAGKAHKMLPTSVPLGDVPAKYTLSGLGALLANPHATRPSGRMPSLLDVKEAKAVATYLLQGAVFEPLAPNLVYAYYEGTWDRLPDFEKLQPIATGKVNGFDLSIVRRQSHFAVRFEGYLRIERDGEYRFSLTSDDGSKLFIDDKLIVDNDGVHAPATKASTVRLAPGMHKLVAGVFNAGGPFELSLDIKGDGLERQALSPHVFVTPEGPPKIEGPAKKAAPAFALDPSLAVRGRETFAMTGCANCHALRWENQLIASRMHALDLAKLRPEHGCLSATPTQGTPWYSLSGPQRAALAAALRSGPSGKLSTTERIAQTLTTFNCYACHDRDKKGGVEEPLNSFFATTQPEMGDEGRVPPSLNGVGAKLNPAYLKHVLANGAHDRPYMLTRMPKFGEANVGHLAAAFAELDKLEPAPHAAFAAAPVKVKAEARHLVGSQALGCIKCHTFAGHKAEGVQGIDMTLLPVRLQRDWFYRYLLEPNKFRPGTRMPTAWPDGQTLLPKVLGGDTVAQIDAIWLYLSDGQRARLPLGVRKEFIPLVPEKEAIVYRNFIEGAGARAIGVGYPEKAHLAFDANDLRLALLWQGGFIDAARHWTDRGAGFEPPLGDNVLHLPAGVSFAVLAKPEDPWPTKSGKELAYKFQGYRLTPDQRPTFLYACGNVTIEDTPNAVVGRAAPLIRRVLTLTANPPVANLTYRAAVGKKIESVGNGTYRINSEWTTRIESAATPRIRSSSGKQELLVPVSFKGGRTVIAQEYVW